MLKLFQILIIALLGILPNFFTIRSGKHLTWCGVLFLTLALSALGIEFCDWCISLDQEYELHENDISFIVRGERDTGDFKSMKEIEGETLEAFDAEYLFIGQSQAQVSFIDRSIKKSTGYRSPMRVGYVYHSNKLLVEKDTPLPKYIWDLNGLEVNLKIPKLLFGNGLNTDKWRLVVELKISDLEYLEQETDGHGKVHFKIKELDKKAVKKRRYKTP